MTEEDSKDLIERLGVVHLRHPHMNPERGYNPRQTILDSIKELTLYRLREQQMQADIAELLTLRASSKTMKSLIADLNQKLSGMPATLPTVAAGAQQRGEAGERPEA